MVGLVLVFYHKRGAFIHLGLNFGLTCTQTTLWLSFGRRVLLYALQNYATAAIQILSLDEIREYENTYSFKYNTFIR